MYVSPLIFGCLIYRLAYPVYLLEKIKQTEGNKNTLLLYDIACVFETHLKVYIVIKPHKKWSCYCDQQFFNFLEPWTN